MHLTNEEERATVMQGGVVDSCCPPVLKRGLERTTGGRDLREREEGEVCMTSFSDNFRS